MSSGARVESLNLDLGISMDRNCLKTCSYFGPFTEPSFSLWLCGAGCLSPSALTLISVLLWQPCRFTSGVVNQRKTMMVIYWNGRPGGLILLFKRCHECRPLTKHLIMHHIWENWALWLPPSWRSKSFWVQNTDFTLKMTPGWQTSLQIRVSLTPVFGFADKTET